ncbi:MAG: zinc-binding dehydrogenase [Methanobrevibacter wolinii]
MPNGKCLTSFFSNYPNQEIIDNIFNMIIDNYIKTKISKVYTSLEDIKKAHKLMETNKAQGKIVFKIA